MGTQPEAYAALRKHLREAGALEGVMHLTAWDKEVYMPERAYAMRGEQMGLLAGLVHERRTSGRLGELIAACEGNAEVMGDPARAANVREARKDYDKATKLPADLVADLARATTMAQQAWKGAREKSDFPGFAPVLEQVLGLLRRKAECLGVPQGGEAYDALLDLYEPGMRAAEVERIFTPLRGRLAELIRAVGASKAKVSTKCLDVEIPAEEQHALGQWVIGQMGFDMKAGRLDTTTHPFCQGMGPGDTRLTTRYRESRFTDALYGTLHEMGHGLYEQGLPKEEHFGEPLGDAVSLGIHESQSRMWENFVGRSKGFWKWLLPKSRKFIGKKLSKWEARDLFAATNTVRPSFIRVEADEGTYNMHVMVRFEVERALLSGAMKVKDIPGEWNRRYKEYLGLDVPDAKRGCLQDVHWSAGLMGYFPTYTLGNLYAAQFWEKINADLPDLPKLIGKGQFGELREWLVKHIHRHGRRFSAGELCERVTGAPLSADPLLRHLTRKAEQVYGV
jgi:carboxypeptidase Taq